MADDIPKCPWCNAEPSFYSEVVMQWHCLSVARMRDGVPCKGSPGKQSDKCRATELEATVERLRKFVVDSPCYCNYHDGRPMCAPCERCELLGEDHRAAKAAGGNNAD